MAALENYAKAKGIWVDDPATAFGKKPLAEGAEQKVYLNKTGKTLSKINSGHYHQSWVEYFDRIELHNELFPETYYTLKGFTKIDGTFSAIVEQTYIEAERNATKEEIVADMAQRGFEHLDKGPQGKFSDDYYNPKTKIKIEDLHGKMCLLIREMICFT